MQMKTRVSEKCGIGEFWEDSTCKECSDNSYRRLNMSQFEKCRTCPTGQTHNSDKSDCEECPAGVSLFIHPCKHFPVDN